MWGTVYISVLVTKYVKYLSRDSNLDLLLRLQFGFQVLEIESLNAG